MTAKYHINPETGNPGKCTAEFKCRFGDADHYESPEAARSAFEAQMASESTNSETLDTYENTFSAYLDGSPQEVKGGMKTFIDESFSLLPPGSKILELGSGFGRDAQYLQDAGYTVIPTDAPAVFVEELQKRGFKAKKLNALTDGLPRTDAIFANAVFLHFSRDELDRVLNKSYRSLNGKGHLAFTVKEGDGEGWSSEKLDSPRHFTYWREEALRSAVEKAGFVDVEISSDSAGPASWLQVHARKPRSTNRMPNSKEALHPLANSDQHSYIAGLNSTMRGARVNSSIVLPDGRSFTKLDMNLYGDNSWRYERESYKYEKQVRLEPGQSYSGNHVAALIARHGGELRE